MDAPRYRALMRHQAGAVAIIAAGHSGARGGLTATAFSSLSDSPPTLLVCVQRKSGTHGVIVAAKSFSVNILAREQQSLAERFSGKGGVTGEHRFEGGAVWETLATGAAVYFSRSRGKLWRKGESSGHQQKVIEIRVDCDADTILLQVEQTGAACHEGYESCFFRTVNSDSSVAIADDRLVDPATVYKQ